jgi:hypothetical protein
MLKERPLASYFWRRSTALCWSLTCRDFVAQSLVHTGAGPHDVSTLATELGFEGAMLLSDAVWRVAVLGNDDVFGPADIERVLQLLEAAGDAQGPSRMGASKPFRVMVTMGRKAAFLQLVIDSSRSEGGTHTATMMLSDESSQGDDVERLGDLCEQSKSLRRPPGAQARLTSRVHTRHRSLCTAGAAVERSNPVSTDSRPKS